MSKVYKIFQEETRITKHLLFWFLLGDFNISNIFYKIQNLNEWQLVSVITHMTYTFLNPWTLNKTWCLFNQRSDNKSI